jgi:prephenate dehydrogenase
MGFKQVAVIGADCISLSIALGLKAHEEPPKIIGYDADQVVGKLARSRGAFDKVERSPERACRGADLVIVAVPLPAIRETFAAIAPQLQPGCLVTDTARLKAPVMRWAKELLPENVFFVGGHPIPNPAIAGSRLLEGIDAANADLLREGLYCLTTPPGVPGTVIDAFAALAVLLEANPFFIDVTEHDGLQAGVEGLPDLLAIALVRATVDTPGWQEMRKFAGFRFAATTVAADDAPQRHTSVLLNREHIVRRLNAVLGELVRLRDILTQGDEEALEETFGTAAEERARWLEERKQGMWIKDRTVSMEHVPSTSERIGGMIFGEYTASRLKKGADLARKE